MRKIEKTGISDGAYEHSIIILFSRRFLRGSGNKYRPIKENDLSLQQKLREP